MEQHGEKGEISGSPCIQFHVFRFLCYSSPFQERPFSKPEGEGIIVESGELRKRRGRGKRPGFCLGIPVEAMVSPSSREGTQGNPLSPAGKKAIRGQDYLERNLQGDGCHPAGGETDLAFLSATPVLNGAESSGGIPFGI